MRSKEDNFQKLLQAAYRNRENGNIRESWRTKAMVQIREIGPLPEIGLLKDPFSATRFAERLIWRFSAAACAAVLVLSIYMLQSDYQTEYELASMYLSDPVEYSLAASLDAL